MPTKGVESIFRLGEQGSRLHDHRQCVLRSVQNNKPFPVPYNAKGAKCRTASQAKGQGGQRSRYMARHPTQSKAYAAQWTPDYCPQITRITRDTGDNY